MSGFCSSNDYVESPPVEKDSGDSIRIHLGNGFHPTDEELISHFLWRKIEDPSFLTTAMEEADLNRLEPWDFPGVFVGKRIWFFFSRRDMKYATGQITTNSGYWETTGEEDREIFKGKTLVGMKKTLVFYRGRAPRGERTEWVMHEYRLEEGHNSLHNLPQNAKNEWVICKVFLKSSLEKKTYISGIQVLKHPVMHKLFFNLILLAIQTLAWASNVEHDSTNEAEVGKHVNSRSFLKRKGNNNNEYVRGVRQLQPKLQKSNSDAENAAAASSSINSHNTTTMEDNSKVCVKVGYNNDTVMFLLPFANMDCLKAEILKRFNMLEAETFKIRYKDEDGEMVTIACDEDLHCCLQFLKSSGTTLVRLSLLKD